MAQLAGAPGILTRFGSSAASVFPSRPPVSSKAGPTCVPPVHPELGFRCGAAAATHLLEGDMEA